MPFLLIGLFVLFFIPPTDSEYSPQQNNRRQLGFENATVAPKIDQRVSGLGPVLDKETLHGGWKFTSAIYDRATRHPNATVISWESPRAVLIHSFLKLGEVQHMIELAEADFQRSQVVSDDAAINKARTSYGAWLNGARRSNTVLQIQHRIAEVTGIPEQFSESLYVLRYEEGQKYEAHTDNCHHAADEELAEACKSFLKRGGGPECGSGSGGPTCGDRLATFILYLQTPEKGGATVFPSAHASIQALGGGSAMTTTTTNALKIDGESTTDGGDFQSRLLGEVKAALEKSGAVNSQFDVDGGEQVPMYCQGNTNVLQVLPKSGDAVLFFDYVPGEGPDSLAVPDPASVHAGCSPTRGTKLIATRWMRSAEFN